MTQFDLTDFAGQKRDLRTMEPVAGKTGHCFVFAGKNSPWRGLGRASMPGRRGRGLLEQGAQVGHGGVALALAREFEVYDMVVHSGGAIDLRI